MLMREQRRPMSSEQPDIWKAIHDEAEGTSLYCPGFL